MPKIAGVNHLQAVKALEKAGFKVIRQGKPIVLSDGNRILTIPRNNPVNAYKMGGIVRGMVRMRLPWGQVTPANSNQPLFWFELAGVTCPHEWYHPLS